MNSVHIKIQEIRKIVNKSHLQDSLIRKDRKKWRQMCACMDVIRDSQEAIDAYVALPDFDAYSGGYLYIYGLLQALYVQQDSIGHLYSALLDKTDLGTGYADLRKIRDIRNDAVGHPYFKTDTV